MEISPYRNRRLAFIALTLAVAASGCKSTGSKSESAAPASELGIVPASMDKSAQPGDDFFAYANGTWVKNTPIPEDRSSIGGFYIADKERERQTRELLDAILKSNPAPGTNDAKIANYYRA
jgi:putative endopeptidase